MTNQAKYLSTIEPKLPHTVGLSSFGPNQFYNSFVGIDKIFEQLNELSNIPKSNNYPPYNIKKLSDTKYQIEIAIAGFQKNEVDITVKDGKLLVEGTKSEVDNDDIFIHKGIATRNFSRTFTLSDTVEVKNAKMENGMLFIEMENIIPEHKKPKKLQIL